MTAIEYEVLAVRYGTVSVRRSEAFRCYERYGELDAYQEMDYFFWLVRGNGLTVLVDTGFAPEVGRRRGRTCLITPLDAMTALGVRPADVDLVVITHAHYDHIGNLSAFPDSRICIQRSEVEHWLRLDSESPDWALVEPEELEYMRGALDAGRVDVLEGDHELSPGLSVRKVGGHTPGQQIVIADTGRGLVVLASDALHFYEEAELDRPYAVASDPAQMRETYGLLNHLAAAGALVVAGHDPSVVSRFKRHDDEHPDIVRIAC